MLGKTKENSQGKFKLFVEKDNLQRCFSRMPQDAGSSWKYRCINTERWYASSGWVRYSVG
jgi:hypothetical protein